MVSIKFWKKNSGNYLAAHDGLTEEQVTELRSLAAGDRLILWYNPPEEGREATFALKKYAPKGE